MFRTTNQPYVNIIPFLTAPETQLDTDEPNPKRPWQISGFRLEDGVLISSLKPASRKKREDVLLDPKFCFGFLGFSEIVSREVIN